jgi:hypothetical protein
LLVQEFLVASVHFDVPTFVCAKRGDPRYSLIAWQELRDGRHVWHTLLALSSSNTFIMASKIDRMFDGLERPPNRAF